MSEGGSGGGALSQFRLTLAMWLEALLMEEDEEDLLVTTQCFTQLLAIGTDSLFRNTASCDLLAADRGIFDYGSSSSGFSQQNSSLEKLFRHSMVACEIGFFPKYGVQYNHDISPQDTDVSSMANFKPIKQEELDDIIRYGSNELFANKKDEAGKSLQIHYDDVSIDRLLDREQVGVEEAILDDEDDDGFLKAFKYDRHPSTLENHTPKASY